MFEVYAAFGQGCAACTAPIEATRPGLEGRLCLRCRQELPTALTRLSALPEFVTAGWCLGPYTGLLGGLVRQAKYGARLGLLASLGDFMAEGAVVAGLADAFDGVAPVPGSLRHRLGRGFEAVEVLAGPVADRVTGRVERVLVRREGAPQAGQSHAARAANVRGVYRARARTRGDWLLIDDVMTTGATASACALALREAGARSVSLLVVAAAAL